jgi:ATP-dependent 26S proteasome regulatory subunit
MPAVWFFLIVVGVLTMIGTLVHGTLGIAAAVTVAVLTIWFLVGMFQQYWTGIARHLKGHLQGQWQQAHVLTHVVTTGERVNLQVALDSLYEATAPRKPILGGPAHSSLPDLIRHNPSPVPLIFENYHRALEETMPCATNAVYRLSHQGEPYCAWLRRRTEGARTQMVLEIMAFLRKTAQGALEAVLASARRLNVYRGAVLSLESSEDPHEVCTIRFHDVRPVERAAIILPDTVLEVIERNVLGLLAHAELLRRAGRPTRHGILLHGPPGTGKTLVTRYLVRACPQYTSISLTGRELALIRESCQLARLLAPSIVVLEDVDLVASQREQNRNTTVLHELMDEMDGLGPKADCIFILTTNRPELLEPALAARPGRIDQAICFPLPDAPCRQQLFALFGQGLDLSETDIAHLVARTDRASPAFLQELVSRAALMAAERGERSEPLRVTSADFDRAMRELLELGGELTKSLLGFRSIGFA